MDLALVLTWYSEMPAIFALLIIVTLAGSLLAQNEDLNSGPVSVSVFSSAATRGNQLLLLVLWRLAPALIGAGYGTQGAFPAEEMRQRISFGVSPDRSVPAIATVSVRIPLPANVAYINNEPIKLADTNVVLVEVGADGRATITNRMRVSPAEPANTGNDHFGEAVIRREPVLREFLHCDQWFADPMQQYVAHTLCARTLGP
jgi:hypothetical protein